MRKSLLALGVILPSIAMAQTSTVIGSVFTFNDDYQQDDNAINGWYIYDDHTGSKGNPLVISQETGKTYHGPTKRDINQGYYRRNFQCPVAAEVSWSADVYYCSPSSSTSNTVHTYFDNMDYGNPFGWVLKNTGAPYEDQALVDATNCSSWEYKQIVEPNGDVDNGSMPVVAANEDFELKFKFRLIGSSDYAAVSNIQVQCHTEFESILAAAQGDTGSQGIQGETGLQGEQGIQGETGAQGESGAQGIQGETGAQGESGEQGIQGETGAKGDTGEQGIQGETGAKGESGEQGIQGETGAKGDTGEQGIQGETGAKGDAGEKGEQGIQGETGPKGDTGVVDQAVLDSIQSQIQCQTMFTAIDFVKALKPAKHNQYSLQTNKVNDLGYSTQDAVACIETILGDDVSIKLAGK